MELLVAGLLVLLSLWLLRGLQFLGAPWSVAWRTTAIICGMTALLWPSLLLLMVSPPFLIALIVLTVVVGIRLGERINAFLRWRI